MNRRTQDIDAAVGLRMAARRSALGLSQTALAEQLGVGMHPEPGFPETQAQVRRFCLAGIGFFQRGKQFL